METQNLVYNIQYVNERVRGGSGAIAKEWGYFTFAQDQHSVGRDRVMEKDGILKFVLLSECLKSGQMLSWWDSGVKDPNLVLCNPK